MWLDASVWTSTTSVCELQTKNLGNKPASVFLQCHPPTVASLFMQGGELVELLVVGKYCTFTIPHLHFQERKTDTKEERKKKLLRERVCWKEQLRKYTFKICFMFNILTIYTDGHYLFCSCTFFLKHSVHINHHSNKSRIKLKRKKKLQRNNKECQFFVFLSSAIRQTWCNNGLLRENGNIHSFWFLGATLIFPQCILPHVVNHWCSCSYSKPYIRKQRFCSFNLNV